MLAPLRPLVLSSMLVSEKAPALLVSVPGRTAKQRLAPAASVQVVLRPVAQMATVRARVRAWVQVRAMLPHLRHRRNASR